MGAGLALAGAAVAAPLATYTVSLAALGLPHVIAEMGYVRRRFSGRWPRPAVVAVVALLAVVVALRISALLGLASAAILRPFELAAVAALAGVTLPLLWRRGAARAVVGGAVVLAVGLGAIVDPLLTAVILAGLHNLTPLGFVAEASPDRRLLFGALLAFVAVPALIATGLPLDGLVAAGAHALEWSPLGAGALSDHLAVYVPRSWLDRPWAVHVFSALVFAQCMHYAAVMHLLPRLAGGRPSLRVAVGLAVVGGLTLWAFTHDFGGSRRLYGVAAAVHAWVEVPVLLAALLGGQAVSRTPTPNEAPLAAADTPSAHGHGAGANPR